MHHISDILASVHVYTAAWESYDLGCPYSSIERRQTAVKATRSRLQLEQLVAEIIQCSASDLEESPASKAIHRETLCAYGGQGRSPGF